jgi:hypothetical protein
MSAISMGGARSCVQQRFGLERRTGLLEITSIQT